MVLNIHKDNAGAGCLTNDQLVTEYLSKVWSEEKARWEVRLEKNLGFSVFPSEAEERREVILPILGLDYAIVKFDFHKIASEILGV